MQILLIAAVMTNQLWFDTQTEADIYIVRPMATLSQNCACQVSIAVSHRADQGLSTSRQQGSVNLAANQTISLGQMRIAMQKGDWTQVTVTLTNSQGLRLERQIIVPNNS
ncbi:MAG: curli assembly chaperone CsgC [Serratia proteamaculans]